MKKTLSGLVAAIGLIGLLSMSTFTPVAHAAKKHATGKTVVKSYTRTTKTGKVIPVKGYTRSKTGKKAKTVKVKSYMRNGKMVHGYTKKVVAKKAAK